MNAVIQLSAILAFQQLAVIWPFYIVMAMICIVIATQTLGAGIAFSGLKLKDTASRAQPGGMHILISILYLVSCCHIYVIGFVGFAWIAGTHSVIHLLTNLIGASKND